VRQSRFCEAVGDPLHVLPVCERQPAEMSVKGISRIDLLEFTPDAPGLIEIAEMTERGGEHGA
jgi:hypothetical protein